MKFSDYNISSLIKSQLEVLGFNRPTDIQFKAIKPILEGGVKKVINKNPTKKLSFANQYTIEQQNKIIINDDLLKQIDDEEINYLDDEIVNDVKNDVKNVKNVVKNVDIINNIEDEMEKFNNKLNNINISTGLPNDDIINDDNVSVAGSDIGCIDFTEFANNV